MSTTGAASPYLPTPLPPHTHLPHRRLPTLTSSKLRILTSPAASAPKHSLTLTPISLPPSPPHTHLPADSSNHSPCRGRLLHRCLLPDQHSPPSAPPPTNTHLRRPTFTSVIGTANQHSPPLSASPTASTSPPPAPPNTHLLLRPMLTTLAALLDVADSHLPHPLPAPAFI